jgi:hypothetical protein
MLRKTSTVYVIICIILYVYEGQNHNIKVGNNSFESVAKFKYFGTTLTSQTAFMKKLKS